MVVAMGRPCPWKSDSGNRYESWGLAWSTDSQGVCKLHIHCAVFRFVRCCIFFCVVIFIFQSSLFKWLTSAELESTANQIHSCVEIHFCSRTINTKIKFDI